MENQQREPYTLHVFPNASHHPHHLVQGIERVPVITHFLLLVFLRAGFSPTPLEQPQNRDKKGYRPVETEGRGQCDHAIARLVLCRVKRDHTSHGQTDDEKRIASGTKTVQIVHGACRPLFPSDPVQILKCGPMTGQKRIRNNYLFFLKIGL
jgi:hypothetical protein